MDILLSNSRQLGGLLLWYVGDDYKRIYNETNGSQAVLEVVMAA